MTQCPSAAPVVMECTALSSAPEPSEISRITRSQSVCVDFDMSLMVSDGSAPFARMKIIGVRSSLSYMTSLKIYGAGFA